MAFPFSTHSVKDSEAVINSPVFWVGQGFELEIDEMHQLSRRDGTDWILGDTTPVDLAKIYTEEDLLANTFYIFLLLVMFTIILGGVFFAAREYSLSFRNSQNLSDVINSIEQEQHQQQQQPSYHLTNHVTEKMEPPSTCCLKEDIPQEGAPDETYSEDSGSISPSIKISTKVFDNLDLKNIPPLSPLHLKPEKKPYEFDRLLVVKPDLTSGEFTGGSITKYLNNEFTPIQIPSSKKITYNFNELYSIQDDVCQSFKAHDLKIYKEFGLLELLKGRLEVPRTEFATIYEADKCINEYKAMALNESSTNSTPNIFRSISLVSILSIGTTSPDNPNYYLTSFNVLIQSMVDSGDIFNLLDESGDLTRHLLMCMVLTYCWNQWKYRTRDNSKIEETFTRWNSTPNVVNQNTIFRVVCNLELGMHALKNRDQEFKLQLLLKHICNESNCNDYLGYIPMIAKAVNISTGVATKVTFYEMVFRIVKKHHRCCMRIYIEDTRTDLKSLIQHGIWHRNDARICEQANRIYYFLTLQGYEINSWIEEVERGKTLVPSAAEIEEEFGIMKKSVTPGSWSTNKEEPTLTRSPSLRQFGYH